MGWFPEMTPELTCWAVRPRGAVSVPISHDGVLIVDEVLAVGDAEFQKKCLGKMQDVAGHGRAVLFVSHNMAAVASLTHTAIVLHLGHVEFIGPSTSAIKTYRALAAANTNPKTRGPRGRGRHTCIRSAGLPDANASRQTNTSPGCHLRSRSTSKPTVAAASRAR